MEFRLTWQGDLPENIKRAVEGRFLGKEVALSVNLYRKDRSTQQNRYLWGIVYAALADATGYTAEEIHKLCKGLFLADSMKLPYNDRRIRTERSTAELNTVEFEQYTERIRRWAAVYLQIDIPEPNEGVYDR